MEKGGGDKATGDEAKGAEKGDKGKAKVEKSGGDEAKGGSNKAKPESKEVVEPQQQTEGCEVILTKKTDTHTNVFLSDCGVRAWREGASLPMVAGACPCSPAPRAAPQSAATGPQPSSGASPQSPSPPCRGCSHSAAQPP